jgi:transcriptional regulator with XRE-family HTH domain
VTDLRLAASLGRRVRRARHGTKQSQRAIATIAGVSQSTISRIELGKGGTIPLETWEHVAAAVDLDLADVLHTPFRSAAFDVQLRCHRLVVDRASAGGWLGRTVVDHHDPAEVTTILERPERDEIAVIRVWDVITNVRDGIDSILARMRRERRNDVALDHGAKPRVGGAVVVVSTGPNRRRLTESAEVAVAGLAIFSLDWWSALGNLRVPMPTGIGTIWTDATLTHLRPRIPYVDGRTRHT